MSSENCLHLIKLINLEQNVIIPHQILIIKGVIDNYKCVQQENISLQVENVKYLTTGLSSDTGRFKFLLDLGVENKEFLLTFSYCNSKLKISIIYERKQSIYKIQPLLLVAADELETGNDDDSDNKLRLNQQIIDLNLLLVQSVYAEKLKESGYERLNFVFNDKCKIFRTKLQKHQIWQLNEHELWLHFAKELLESDWGNQEQLKFIAFIANSKYLGEEVEKSQDFSYQNIRKHIKGHAALGTGGLALFSCTYFYAWPNTFENILNCFENQQNLDLSKEPDDSNYRKTRCGVYASSLGAVCHEIGHIFDLGHDREGVMGTNFDYINQVFTLPSQTEHLPLRIVETKPNSLLPTLTKPRFTQLKSPANGFLLRYREQQENDSFYFSTNSAVILAHHFWLRKDFLHLQLSQFEVEFVKSSCLVKSIKFPLKLLEIRETLNSLVVKWFELQKRKQEQPVFEYSLKSMEKKLLKDHYIFVMSIYGHTKKLEI